MVCGWVMLGWNQPPDLQVHYNKILLFQLTFTQRIPFLTRQDWLFWKVEGEGGRKKGKLPSAVTPIGTWKAKSAKRPVLEAAPWAAQDPAAVSSLGLGCGGQWHRVLFPAPSKFVKIFDLFSQASFTQNWKGERRGEKRIRRGWPQYGDIGIMYWMNTQPQNCSALLHSIVESR